MSFEKQLGKMFQDGLGDCPSFETKLSYSQGNKVSEWDTGHIKLCPICEKEIAIFKSEEFVGEEWLPEKSIDAIQKIEKELLANRYSKALSLANNLVWEHSKGDKEVQALFQIFLVRTEMLIQRHKWSHASKLLDFCENMMKLSDARIPYFNSVILEEKGELKTASKLKKMAENLQPGIEELYKTSKEFFLSVKKDTILKIVEVKDSLLEVSHLLIEEIIDGSGKLQATRGEGKNRGQSRILKFKDQELRLKVNSKKKTISVEGASKGVSLKDSNGESIFGKKEKESITFHLE